MTVLNFLKQPQAINMQIERYLSELLQWDEILREIAASKDMRTTSEVAYVVNMCSAIEDTAFELLKEMAEATEKVVEVITRLDDPAERDLLLKLYIQGKTLQEITEDTGETCLNIAKIHGSAMKNVVTFLRG